VVNLYSCALAVLVVTSRAACSLPMDCVFFCGCTFPLSVLICLSLTICWRVVQIIAQRDCKGGHIGILAPTLSEASHPAPISAADAAAWAGAFEEYFAERKTNTDAIADLALENFEEVNFRCVALHGCCAKPVRLY
jgi:hypothetical protein